MRVRWLLPSFLGAIAVLCLSSSPVEAARLLLWRFNAEENRLTFSTDEGVQPRVQLIANPTRLVIDLPGTSFGRSQVEEAVGGTIREVRVGQYDASTTRIVIELEEGYILNPDEVRVRGTTSNQWTVELPEPEESDTFPVADSGDNNSSNNSSNSSSDNRESSQVAAETLVEELRLTPDGIFIRTRGETPDVDDDYSRRRRRLTVELEDTALSPQIVQRQITLDQYGIERIELEQVEDEDEDDPPRVEITLYFQEDSPRWRTTVSDFGGVVLVPRESRVLSGVTGSQSLTGETASAPLPVPDRPIPVPAPDTSSEPSYPTSPLPLPDVSDSDVVVTIDPGHGGRDPGAVGIGGLQETGIVLDISLQVAQLLEEQGVRVVLTRQDEREIDLEPRVQTANRAGSDLFVSIHANAISLSRPDVNGVETYYYSDAGQRFAQVIHDAVIEGTGSNDRGVRFARFYVLRNTAMPAVLVEVGFVTGEVDAERLSDPDFREQMAESIAAGILQYIQQNF